jgi:hypothetical protein
MTQQEKKQEPASEPTKEELEHAAARLYREIETLEAKKKAVLAPINQDIATKRKELRSVTEKLVTLDIQRRAQ